ncbi:MAG: hypothetical protein P8Z36_10525 [Gemmatimonadota bacterium]
MRTMRILTLAVATTLAAAACSRAPKLDTRTFQLEYLSAHDAQSIIAPYVYADRQVAPGMISSATHTISVRETPDNLDKIARVLKENDKAPQTVRLTFQVIRADGQQKVDPAIADVEQELKRLFRYDGYALVGQASLEARSYADYNQTVFAGQHYGPVPISGYVGSIRKNQVDMQISMGHLLETQITVGDGKAVVLGTPIMDGAIILVVRADLQDGGSEAG